MEITKIYLANKKGLYANLGTIPLLVYIRLFIILCVLGYISNFTCYSQEDPSVDELVSLLGKKISSPEVINVIEVHRLTRFAKQQVGGNSMISPLKTFSLAYKNRRINRIAIFLRGHPSTPYGKSLPFGIKANWNKSDYVNVLGPSQIRDGNLWSVGGLRIRVFFDKDSGKAFCLYFTQKN